jgi:hypothetical protein
VRTPTGPTEYRELLDFESVCYDPDIGDDIGHLPKFQPIRAPVAGPVKGDQTYAERVQDHGTRERADSASRCPVH